MGNNLSPFYRGLPLFEITKTFFKIRKFKNSENKKIQENTKNKKIQENTKIRKFKKIQKKKNSRKYKK